MLLFSMVKSQHCNWFLGTKTLDSKPQFKLMKHVSVDRTSKGLQNGTLYVSKLFSTGTSSICICFYNNVRHSLNKMAIIL